MNRSQLVVVGASWGGMAAIGRLLDGLPASFRTPIVLVQHRAQSSASGVLRSYLAARTTAEVVDAEDKEPIEEKKVYLAPPDYHLLVDDGLLGLSLEAPVVLSRPSVDVLFESAAESYGSGLVAVVLTGANADGAEGALAVRRAGGRVLVQDPEEAERPEMPNAVIRAGAADEILRIEDLAARLAEWDS